MQEIVTASRVKKLTGKFTHRVEGWSALSRNVGDHVESPEVELCGKKWRIRIFPGGSSHKHSSHISMYLANRSAYQVSASYKLFVHNHDTEEEELIFQSNGVKLFETQGQGKIDGWGRDRFLPHSRCSEQSICKDDTIIFLVEISVYGSIEAFSHNAGTGSTLDQDMSSLYTSQVGSDLQVLVHGTADKYLLHRSVLSARSSVFRAMLSHPTQENETGVIVLHEDDPAIVGDFFRFLYTDYISTKTITEHAPELLIMASKYQIPLLAALCEQAIVSSLLNVENAIPLFQFADTHGSTSMQNSIVRFIKHNADEVLNHSEYTALVDEQKHIIRRRVLADDTDNSMTHRYSRFGPLSPHNKTGKFSFCCVM